MTRNSRSITVAFAIAVASIVAACGKDNAVESNTNNVCARGETTCRGDELFVCNASLTGFDLLGSCSPGTCVQGKSTCPGVDAGAGGSGGEKDASAGAGGAELGGSSGWGGTGEGGSSGEGGSGGTAGSSGEGGSGGVDAGAGGAGTGGKGGAAGTSGAAGTGGIAGAGGTGGVGGAGGSTGTGGTGGSSGCPNNCVDGKACTDDVCTAGVCSNPLKADWCLISNACVAKDAAQSGNVCMTCQPSASTSKYTAVPDEAAKSCGSQQVCKAGACVSDCEDADGDGYGTGTTCLGPDCNDGDYNNWFACSTCVDSDGDGYSQLCDQYVANGVKGPDCDDEAPTCAASCTDADSTGMADCAEYWVRQAASSQSAYHRVIPTIDGGQLVLGVPGSGNNRSVTKLTRKGAVAWTKNLGNANPNEALVVEGGRQLADGGFLLTGFVQLAQYGKSLFLRLDANGAIVWSKQEGLMTEWVSDNILAAVETADGNFVVLGDRDTPSFTKHRLWIAKLHKNGSSFLWEKLYLHSNGKPVHTARLVPTTGGGFAAVASGLAGTRLIFFNSSGDVLSHKQIGSGAAWEVTGPATLVRTSTGNLVMAVSLTNSDCSSTAGIFVAAIDESGAVLWSKRTLAQNVCPMSLSLAADDAGRVYLRAYAESNGSTLQSADWLARFDANGNVDWNRKIEIGEISGEPDIAISGSRLLLVESPSQTLGIEVVGKPHKGRDRRRQLLNDHAERHGLRGLRTPPSWRQHSRHSRSSAHLPTKRSQRIQRQPRL